MAKPVRLRDELSPGDRSLTGRAFLTNDATLKRASVLRVLVLDELAL